jgi:hypothetical protein
MAAESSGDMVSKTVYLAGVLARGLSVTGSLLLSLPSRYT